MPSTLNIPISLAVDVHEIQGGGYWGEVRQFPGCVAQAETLEALASRILLAIEEWWAEPGVQTEETARKLAAIQGGGEIPKGPYPRSCAYQAPPTWTEAEEDE